MSALEEMSDVLTELRAKIAKSRELNTKLIDASRELGKLRTLHNLKAWLVDLNCSKMSGDELKAAMLVRLLEEVDTPC